MTKDQADALVRLIDELSDSAEAVSEARVSRRLLSQFSVGVSEDERKSSETWLALARQQYAVLRRRVWTAIDEATDKKPGAFPQAKE